MLEIMKNCVSRKKVQKRSKKKSREILKNDGKFENLGKNGIFVHDIFFRRSSLSEVF